MTTRITNEWLRRQIDAEPDDVAVEAGGAMHIPETEREALKAVMEQAEDDMRGAHKEICRLAGLDPETHDWPEWSPQANSQRWFEAIREKFNIRCEP